MSLYTLDAYAVGVIKTGQPHKGVGAGVVGGVGLRIVVVCKIVFGERVFPLGRRAAQAGGDVLGVVIHVYKTGVRTSAILLPHLAGGAEHQRRAAAAVRVAHGGEGVLLDVVGVDAPIGAQLTFARLCQGKGGGGGHRPVAAVLALVDGDRITVLAGALSAAAVDPLQIEGKAALQTAVGEAQHHRYGGVAARAVGGAADGGDVHAPGAADIFRVPFADGKAVDFCREIKDAAVIAVQLPGGHRVAAQGAAGAAGLHSEGDVVILQTQVCDAAVGEGEGVYTHPFTLRGADRTHIGKDAGGQQGKRQDQGQQGCKYSLFHGSDSSFL